MRTAVAWLRGGTDAILGPMLVLTLGFEGSDVWSSPSSGLGLARTRGR